MGVFESFVAIGEGFCDIIGIGWILIFTVGLYEELGLIFPRLLGDKVVEFTKVWMLGAKDKLLGCTLVSTLLLGKVEGLKFRGLEVFKFNAGRYVGIVLDEK